MKRAIYLFAGYLSLLLGLIGVVLPLLPTTPFVLLAAFFFSRSSEKLHKKLLNNKVFGELIKRWEQDGTIPLKAKLLATVMMLTMVSYPLIYRPLDMSVKLLVVGAISLSLAYIWSRPSLANA
ncbi:MAG: YbaN family protein [Neptuniibacter sp.]